MYRSQTFHSFQTFKKRFWYASVYLHMFKHYFSLTKYFVFIPLFHNILVTLLIVYTCTHTLTPHTYTHISYIYIYSPQTVKMFYRHLITEGGKINAEFMARIFYNENSFNSIEETIGYLQLKICFLRSLFIVWNSGHAIVNTKQFANSV